jgi:hypothetical protein
MRKLIVASAGAILLVLGVVTAASAAAPGGQAAAPGSAATTVTFTAKTTQVNQIDLPPAGFGQGDEAVFHDQLRQSGMLIGHAGGVCQATFVANGQVPQYQCVVTFVLPGGRVTVQGLLDIANPASFTGQYAVTGGTGSYEGAGGQATIHQTTATLATITLSITP